MIPFKRVVIPWIYFIFVWEENVRWSVGDELWWGSVPWSLTARIAIELRETARTSSPCKASDWDLCNSTWGNSRIRHGLFPPLWRSFCRIRYSGRYRTSFWSRVCRPIRVLVPRPTFARSNRQGCNSWDRPRQAWERLYRDGWAFILKNTNLIVSFTGLTSWRRNKLARLYP